jgi:micrococcal nuclease
MNSGRLVLSFIVVALALLAQLSATSCSAQGQQNQSSSGERSLPPQTREHGNRISVNTQQIVVDDGDTVVIAWSETDSETVRILGIDTPETRHLPHNIPYAQEFGPEARAFAQGAFAAATEVELLRAATTDPYDRTLGYLFINGANYSVLVVKARLAVETVSFYGDSGFPDEAAAVKAAAEGAGPVPFQPPFEFRRRMRQVTEWMKEQGIYPEE